MTGKPIRVGRVKSNVGIFESCPPVIGLSFRAEMELRPEMELLRRVVDPGSKSFGVIVDGLKAPETCARVVSIAAPNTCIATPAVTAAASAPVMNNPDSAVTVGSTGSGGTHFADAVTLTRELCVSSMDT
jgi:hypothetical protein